MNFNIFICPFCNSEPINAAHEFNHIFYYCNCRCLYCKYYDEKNYFWHLELTDDYEIQIQYFLNHKTFIFLKYSDDCGTYSVARAILKLKYVPDLNWQNAESMLNQLSSLITFN